MIITHFILDNTLHNLTIQFSESTEINDVELSFEYLRICGEENLAKKTKQGQNQVTSNKKDVLLVAIESVAKHGYRLIFNDEHTVIYSEVYLQKLALEYAVRWPKYLAELKDSGHSREAMIDFKQL